MSVRIIPDGDPRENPGGDYLRVSTCNDPLDDTVTLATIERVVEKRRQDDTSPPVHVKTIVSRKRMSPDEAIGLATCYAERKNIPVIFTR